jgi:hypothetical protein
MILRIKFMMQHSQKFQPASFLLVCLIFYLFSNIGISFSQSDNFVLEAEQHWDTYGIGGTCIPGTQNLVLSDVDNDGVIEIVTGGFSYSRENAIINSLGAPLRIWSWNGQNLTLEKGENWPGNIGCITVEDADGDGVMEILTAGRLSDNTKSGSSLRLWNWNGDDLSLRGSYTGVSISSIFVGDVDKDNMPEILTTGRAYNNSQSNAQLDVWSWNGKNLTLKKSAEWSATNDIARANSVYASDLNGDGLTEIVTCGYVNSPKNSSGQLRVWQFNGIDLSLKTNVEWRIVNGYSVDNAGNVMGNTMAHTVKADDVDNDGFPEILTGGFTYDGEKVKGQLRIWNWTKGSLNLEKSQEWATSDITELKSISVNDVDGDGEKEIVTSGSSAGYGSFAQDAADKAQAQIRVWGWDGCNLRLKQSKDWIVGEAVCAWNVGTGDLDNDATIEIVTVGCMQIEKTSDCDPDLRVWSLSVASTLLMSLPYVHIAIIGSVVVVLVALALYMIVKRRR